MGKISKLFNRFSKQQPSFAETGTNEQHHVDDEHEKEEKKVKENNSSLHEEEVTKKEQKKKSDGKAHIYNLIIVDESGFLFVGITVAVCGLPVAQVMSYVVVGI